MPEKPIPENDPVVSKSFAPHYVISMVLLMATLFWALWDEDFGQRPWKTFQHEWKSRYSTFLQNASTQSGDSQKEVESSADYQALEQVYLSAKKNAEPRYNEINEKLRDLSGKILGTFWGLRWLGLDWDEGPFYQSQRLDRYRDAAEKCLANGSAFLCYCAAEKYAGGDHAADGSTFFHLLPALKQFAQIRARRKTGLLCRMHNQRMRFIRQFG